MKLNDEINELFYGKHRLWVEILNKAFEDPIEVGRSKPLGFLVVEPENSKFHHVPSKKRATKTKNKETYTPKIKKTDRRLSKQV